MAVLMLVFALTAAGNEGMMTLKFPTMDACEAARAGTLEKILGKLGPNGSLITNVAAVCTEQVRLGAS